MFKWHAPRVPWPVLGDAADPGHFDAAARERHKIANQNGIHRGDPTKAIMLDLGGNFASNEAGPACPGIFSGQQNFAGLLVAVSNTMYYLPLNNKSIDGQEPPTET
jgi:hypothetical protein